MESQRDTRELVGHRADGGRTTSIRPALRCKGRAGVLSPRVYLEAESRKIEAPSGRVWDPDAVSATAGVGGRPPYDTSYDTDTCSGDTHPARTVSGRPSAAGDRRAAGGRPPDWEMRRHLGLATASDRFRKSFSRIVRTRTRGARTAEETGRGDRADRNERPGFDRVEADYCTSQLLAGHGCF